MKGKGGGVEKLSNKLKKRLQNTTENYRIFFNTRSVIIEKKVFERVQELRANKHRSAKQAEWQGLFSGLLYCALYPRGNLKAVCSSTDFCSNGCVFDDIQSFQKAVYQQRFAEAEKTVKWQKKELEQARKRIAELERIFKRIYEDDINGTISQSRF